jgi:hypothetical protein
MRKKQIYTPIIRELKHWEAPNRKTFRQLKKLKQIGKLEDVTFERITQTQYTDSNKRDFKQFRRELALEHGSETGQRKKKHIHRERLKQISENL